MTGVDQTIATLQAESCWRPWEYWWDPYAPHYGYPPTYGYWPCYGDRHPGYYQATPKVGVGWKCPNCGAGVAPSTDVCPNCKPVSWKLTGIEYGADNGTSDGTPRY